MPETRAAGGAEFDDFSRAAAIAAMGQRLAAAGKLGRARMPDRIDPPRHGAPPEAEWTTADADEAVAPAPIPWRSVVLWSRRVALLGGAAASGFGLVYASMTIDLARRHVHRAPVAAEAEPVAAVPPLELTAAAGAVVAPPAPPSREILVAELGRKLAIPAAAPIPATMVAPIPTTMVAPIPATTAPVLAAAGPAVAPPVAAIAAAPDPVAAAPRVVAAAGPPSAAPAAIAPRHGPPIARLPARPRPVFFALPRLHVPAPLGAPVTWRLAEARPNPPHHAALPHFALPRWITDAPPVRLAAAAPRPRIMSPLPRPLSLPPEHETAAAARAPVQMAQHPDTPSQQEADTASSDAAPPDAAPERPALPPIRERPAIYSTYGGYAPPPPYWGGPPPGYGYAPPGWGGPYGYPGG